MPFTPTWRNEVLNYLFNHTAMSTLPASVFVGLHVGATAPADDGTGIVEPSDAAYQRVSVACDTAHWPSTTTGTISNASTVTYAQATSDWGTPTHWFLANVQKGGAGEKIMVVGTIDIPSGSAENKPVMSGDTADFGAGALKTTLT